MVPGADSVYECVRVPIDLIVVDWLQLSEPSSEENSDSSPNQAN